MVANEVNEAINKVSYEESQHNTVAVQANVTVTVSDFDSNQQNIESMNNQTEVTPV